MIGARQHAYLEALDIPVWIRKELAGNVSDFVPCSLKLGPGSGHLLLVCSALEDPASKIASDIGRCLRSEPVWAWPDSDGLALDITTIVREHLFTSILIFGETLAARMFDGAIPETLGSARLLTVPALQELAVSPPARRSLWQVISANRLARQAGT
jgi:DNA polymerase III psi subunit